MKNFPKKFGKIFSFVYKRDVRAFRAEIQRLSTARTERKNYERWLKAFGNLSKKDRLLLREEREKFALQPLISVILPVYNIEEKWLRLCLESVINQVYENWELCVADDCSTKPHVRRVLKEYATRDARIKIVFRPENNHISAASNSALEMASGEFAALLDHDDELSADALFYIVKEINDFPETDFIYSDEDMIDRKGKRFDPKFKPDFSLDFLYSLNYLTHFAVYRTALLRESGGFRIGFEGSQDYDLALRIVEKIGADRIRHVPRILYHWRAIKGSVALSESEKPYAHERARQAIGEHFDRTGVKAIVAPTVYNFHRIIYDLPKKKPKINLLILTADDVEQTRKTIANYSANTTYPNYEFVLIGSKKSKNALENLSCSVATQIVVCENCCAAEQYNAAAASADGDLLCFADSNLKPLSNKWLEEMVRFANQPEIGAVGAKVSSADKTILHAGLIIGAASM